MLVILAVATYLYARDDGPPATGTGAPADATTVPPAPSTTPAPPDTSASPTTDGGAEPSEGGDRSPEQLLAGLVVEPEAGGGSYEREEFGRGWAEAGADCDVRDEVLAVESTVDVVRGADGCTVERGSWVSLYDGYSTPDPAELEIDHLVPLAEAWASGASAWPDARRAAFYNDTRHADALIAVTAATNRSKGDKDPAEWMPSARDSWCRYATAWVVQKQAWRLTIDAAEKRALTNVLAGC